MLAVLLGCGSHSPTSPGAPTTETLTGTVTDPAGDSSGKSLLPTPPDLVGGSVMVDNGSLTIAINFAPDTLSAATGFFVYLDTDENVQTGKAVYFNDSRPIGADYVVTGLTPHDPSRAALVHFVVPDQSVFTGTVAVEQPTGDQRRLTLPLTRLGNDDGRLQFKVECYQIVASSQSGQTVSETSVLVDLMPDFGQPPGVVR